MTSFTKRSARRLPTQRPTRWVGGFHPGLIAGLAARYDATVGVTDAGAGAVSAWADQSGNGRDLSQGTAGNRPITGTRTQNGLNVIDFVSADFLSSANITQAQPLTVLVVAKSDVTTIGVGNRQILGNTAATTSPTVYARNAAALRWGYFAGTEVDSGDAVDTNPHQLSTIFDGASSEQWLDGTSIVTGTPGTAGWSTEPITLGADSTGAAATAWDGWIAEVLIYSGVLSAANRLRVEAYLRQKWGTP